MKIKVRSIYDNFPDHYGESNKQINLYVDNNVMDEHTEEDIALLVEPRAIIPDVYTWIEGNYEQFKYIFTFDSKLLNLPNAKRLIYGTITAEFPDIPKTKNISMIASNKDLCEGHINRKRIAYVLSDRIDTFGQFNGGPYCDDATYMSGYRFNVAMENYSDGHYFTEKICNCFASRTVPIYWGCPHIGEYFDMDGIIYCNTPDDVIKAVDRVLMDPIAEYDKHKEAIEKNLKAVQKYRKYEDLFFETYGKELDT